MEVATFYGRERGLQYRLGLLKKLWPPVSWIIVAMNQGYYCFDDAWCSHIGSCIVTSIVTYLGTFLGRYLSSFSIKYLLLSPVRVLLVRFLCLSSTNRQSFHRSESTSSRKIWALLLLFLLLQCPGRLWPPIRFPCLRLLPHRDLRVLSLSNC